MNLAPATGTLEIALAHANRLLGEDPALASEQVEEILKSYPRLPVAWMLLGLAQGRLGLGEQALVSLRQALALNPDLPQAWRALGDHLTAIGDSAGADEAYGQHVSHSVRDPRLLAAAAALHENRLPEAETLLKRHLHAHPTDVAAIRMLAEMAMRLGRNEDAENLLERCLELAPSFREARQNYALVLNRNQQSEKALAELESMLATDPGNPSHRMLKASILCRIGEYEQGIALYEQIISAYPNNPRVWLSHGHALKTAGQQAAAVEAYRRCLALDPSFGEAYWSLANLKTVRFDDTDIARMRAQLQRPELADEHRLQFEFALAKALEDKNEYEESFRHYLEGNRLRLAAVPYSAKDNHVRVIAATRTYTREFFEQRRGWGEAAPDPIFIVGLPRSGSTLIEQILASHPQVEGTMELPEIIAMTRQLRRQAGGGPSVSYHEVVAGLEPERVQELGREYLARTRIQRKAGRPFFIDKMPNNFLHLGLIRLLFPAASVIHCVRNPLDTCVSCFTTQLGPAHAYSNNLGDLAHAYGIYRKLMAFWADALDGPMLDVVYEDVVADVADRSRRIIDFVGLPWDDRCLRFHETRRTVGTASLDQVRSPIYDSSMGRWKRYEKHLGPLIEGLKEYL